MSFEFRITKKIMRFCLLFIIFNLSIGVSAGGSKLIESLKKKDFHKAVKIINKKGVDLNFKDKDGNTALIIVNNELCESRPYNRETIQEYAEFEKIFYLIIEKGTDLDIGNSYGKTALMNACQYNKKDIAKLLLSKGADINSQKKDGGNDVLIYYVRNKRGKADISFLEYLLSKGADINYKTKNGHSGFLQSIRSNDIDIIEFFLLKGCDINSKDKDGNSTLIIAVESGREKSVEFLISKGANINDKDQDGIPALAIAIKNLKLFDAYKKIVELLLLNGADYTNCIIDSTPLLKYITTKVSKLEEERRKAKKDIGQIMRERERSKSPYDHCWNINPDMHDRMCKNIAEKATREIDGLEHAQQIIFNIENNR